MKNNKFTAFVTAVTLVISLFAGFSIVAEAKTTTYTWDFTDANYFAAAFNAGSTIISDRNEETAIMQNPGAKLSTQNNKLAGYAVVAKAEATATNAITITVPEGTSATISMQLTAGSSDQPSVLRDSSGAAVLTSEGYTKNTFGDAYTAELTCGETYSLDTTAGKPYIGKVVLTVVTDGADDPEPQDDPSPTPTATTAVTTPSPTPTTAAETDAPSEDTELLSMTENMTLSFDKAGTYESTQLFCDGYLKAYAASGKSLVVDGSNKTINGHSYSFRMKYGGNGTVDGANSVRVLEVLPDEPGTIEVDFAHASNSGDDRSITIKQGDMTETKTVEANGLSYLTVEVKGGQSVYIYPAAGAVNLYGIIYTIGAEIKPTDEPVETEKPANAAELDAAALKIKAVSQDAIYFDIDLPSSGDNGSTITWESSDRNYIDVQMVSSIQRNYTGVVTRPEDNDPKVENGGVPVTLTATVKNGDQTVTKTFDVSVRTRKNVVYSNDFQQDVGKGAEGTYKEISDNVTPSTTAQYDINLDSGETKWRSAPFRGIRIDTLKESRAFSQFNHNDKDTSAFFDKRLMSTKDTTFGNPKDSAGADENFVFYYSEYTPYGGSSTIPLWIELTDEATGKGPEGIVMMSMDIYVANGYNQFNIGMANSSPAQMCRFMLGADHKKTFKATNYVGANYLRCFNNEASVDFLGGKAGYIVPENKWVKAVMIANTDSHKWDLYFDGMQIAAGLDFRNAEDYVSNIEFVLNRSYPRVGKNDPVAVYLIDNIYVENLTKDYAESYWDAVEISSLDYDEDKDEYIANANEPFLLQYQGTDGLSGNYFSWVSSNPSALSVKTQRIPVEDLAQFGYSQTQIAKYNSAGIKDVSVVTATPGKVTKDTEVTLRATITVGEDDLEKEFKVLVKADTSSPTPTPKTTPSTTGGSGGGGGGGGGGGSTTSAKTTTSGTSASTIASGNNNQIVYTTPEPKTIPSVVSFDDEVFTDLPEAEWARNAILYLYSQDVVNGYGNGLYGVKDDVTREQFVRMLLVALDVPIYKDETPTFSDVVEGSWYEYYVETALKMGVVSGISETEFGVGMPISRQDMAVMAKRALDYVNHVEPTAEPTEAPAEEVTDPTAEPTEAPAEEVTEPTAEPETEEPTAEPTAEPEATEAPAEETTADEIEQLIEKLTFTDTEDIADYALAAVAEMASKGIINGYEDGSFRPKNTLTRAETAVVIYKIMTEVYANE
ncbi:MAG: S-layer homology domain-containing protein [Clostridia bacterium]|nr:S-layer homology domain-containing protein [Clostridia bacterium]